MRVEMTGDSERSTLSTKTHSVEIVAVGDRFKVSCTCDMLLSDKLAFITTSTHGEAMRQAVAHLFDNWKED